jgi:hypothetical protein
VNYNLGRALDFPNASMVDMLLDHGARPSGAQLRTAVYFHGAALVWDDGSAIGAALHGSRHCHDPQGGPTMRTVDEVVGDHAGVVRWLLAVGAPIPARPIDDIEPRDLIARLGIDPT